MKKEMKKKKKIDFHARTNPIHPEKEISFSSNLLISINLINSSHFINSKSH